MALKKPATEVATQLDKLKEESTAFFNEMKTFGGPTESICKMMEECDGRFEENVESIARMHESANEKAERSRWHQGGSVKWHSVISGI